MGGGKTEEAAIEKKKAQVEIERSSEHREEANKAPLLAATRKVLQKGREELELINVLMTERPKIRPVRTILKRRIDEICGSRKPEKARDQGQTDIS